MSEKLKKELIDAISVIDGTDKKDEKVSEIAKVGRKNRKIRDTYKVVGWCFEGDHLIIDLQGGE